ncbi:MAG: DUF2807 domain-containing protein, partial [Marinilabiliales bacterium]|nr:DUF2807 domain-containing protein [Marinilabiliales bacterium]
VSVHSAIQLILRQGTEEKVVVEAEADVIPEIRTEVSGGELRIDLKGHFHHIQGEMRVYVTAKQLNAIESSSASRVKAEGKIESQEMKIHANSGSGIALELNCTRLEVKASSGASIKLNGSAKELEAEGSSGCSLSVADLVAETGHLSVSSGASLSANVTKSVHAQASSGGRINVSGNPAVRESDSSSGGSVRFK